MNSTIKLLSAGFLTAALVGVSAITAFACYQPTQIIDLCANIDEIQSSVPEGYHVVNDNQCVPDEKEPPVDVCPEEEGDQPTGPCLPVDETPSPTPEQPQSGGWSPEPEGNKSTTDAPGVCSINDIGDVTNINVLTGTPNDGTVEVQWSLPQNADQVHILYGEYGKPYEHALLNTPNDGHEEIHGLKNGVNYNFKVAGVRGCGVGNYSKEFD